MFMMKKGDSMKRMMFATNKQVKHVISIAIAALFSFFIVISIFNALYQYKEQTGEIIAKEVQQLAAILTKINETAEILSFDEQKNRIDFLTIKKGGFVSSEVGAMNLKHPDGWQGPYVDRTPTIQNKEYQVVYTKKGYFITPGDGVKLPNKKVVGKDIILDKHADIKKLMRDEQALMFEGKPLAAEILIGKTSRGYAQAFDLDDDV